MKIIKKPNFLHTAMKLVFLYMNGHTRHEPSASAKLACLLWVLPIVMPGVKLKLKEYLCHSQAIHHILDIYCSGIECGTQWSEISM